MSAQSLDITTVLVMYLHILRMFRRNIDDEASGDYLKSCNYNSSDEVDRYCPIFSLGQIVEMAGENLTALSITVSPIPVPWWNR